MQPLIIAALLISVLIIQGGVNILGGFDLLLPLLIALSVRCSENEFLLFSFAAGFLQDVLFALGFINTFVKTAVALIIVYLKNFITLEKEQLCSLLALIFTPTAIILSLIFSYVFRSVDHASFSIFNLVVTTIINAILAPAFYWLLIRKLPDE